MKNFRIGIWLRELRSTVLGMLAIFYIMVICLLCAKYLSPICDETFHFHLSKYTETIYIHHGLPHLSDIRGGYEICPKAPKSTQSFWNRGGYIIALDLIEIILLRIPALIISLPAMVVKIILFVLCPITWYPIIATIIAISYLIVILVHFYREPMSSTKDIRR